jgi:hypothetical protein
MAQNGTLSGEHGRKANRIHLFVTALLSRAGIEAAAKAAGISVRTAWRGIHDPEVQARLREARKDAMNAAMVRLQEAASGAVDCLCQVQEEGESESARRAAELGDSFR